MASVGRPQTHRLAWCRFCNCSYSNLDFLGLGIDYTAYLATLSTIRLDAGAGIYIALRSYPENVGRGNAHWYGAYWNGRLLRFLYIGKTGCFEDRYSFHERQDDFDAAGVTAFLLFYAESERLRALVELDLIRSYHPPLNDQGRGTE